MIHELPVKFGHPTKTIDNYVWTPDCSLNIKLREQDLKIKELTGFQPCYINNTLGIPYTLSNGRPKSIAFQFQRFL